MSAGTVTGLNMTLIAKMNFTHLSSNLLNSPVKKITKISRSKLLQIFLFTVQKWLTADSDKFNITVCRFPQTS